MCLPLESEYFKRMPQSLEASLVIVFVPLHPPSGVGADSLRKTKMKCIVASPIAILSDPLA